MVRLDKISYLITAFKARYKDTEQYQYTVPPINNILTKSARLLLGRIGVFSSIEANSSIDQIFYHSFLMGEKNIYSQI